MNATGVRIAGVGHFVPERVITNADLERMLDTSDEWITTRTGMKERHAARLDEPTSDLALAASRNALAQAGLEAADLNCIIVATVTPDYAFPATACVLGSKLGISGIAAFDMEIGCSGFIYGLTVASSLVRTGVFRRVLLVGAEELTRLVNYEDRSTAILFGDGAGAVVLEAAEIDSYLGAELGADGSRPEDLYLPFSGTAQPPPTAEDVAAKRNTIHMNGREVFRFAVTKMIEATNVALERAGVTADDVTWLIPHQANQRIIDAAAKYLNMPSDRVVVNIDRYGNTSAASIPMALSEAVAAGKLKDGDVILFVGFGAGLSWGAVAWRWSATRKAAA
ncbi:MAG: 3-oxoacyl-[acyl-carrier-protein] synthase-3 [Candidatus Eremiobacteraeota bacterium]|nr:3-oxoacyl-[acyl-carrier-protein] synthase-3 [Candidatus Eremiobacteraeota bacterium]